VHTLGFIVQVHHYEFASHGTVSKGTGHIDIGACSGCTYACFLEDLYKCSIPHLGSYLCGSELIPQVKVKVKGHWRDQRNLFATHCCGSIYSVLLVKLVGSFKTWPLSLVLEKGDELLFKSWGHTSTYVTCVCTNKQRITVTFSKTNRQDKWQYIYSILQKWNGNRASLTLGLTWNYRCAISYSVCCAYWIQFIHTDVYLISMYLPGPFVLSHM